MGKILKDKDLYQATRILIWTLCVIAAIVALLIRILV